MTKPIAYTYDADTHCPSCTFERFPQEPGRLWQGTNVDSEGNTPGAIAPWDEWHEAGAGVFTLSCGTCGVVIEQCRHEPIEGCDCDDCREAD